MRWRRPRPTARWGRATGSQIRRGTARAWCSKTCRPSRTWREGLDEAKRCWLNHPGAIWARWRRATAISKPRVRFVVGTAKGNGNGKAVFWSQDQLRRAHRAMLDSRSSDLLRLARVALEGAADRHEASIGGGTERRLRSNVEGICTRPNYAERVDVVLSSMEPAAREMGQTLLQSIMSN
jgi:hypothetical protein